MRSDCSMASTMFRGSLRAGTRTWRPRLARRPQRLGERPQVHDGFAVGVGRQHHARRPLLGRRRIGLGDQQVEHCLIEPVLDGDRRFDLPFGVPGQVPLVAERDDRHHAQAVFGDPSTDDRLVVADVAHDVAVRFVEDMPDLVVLRRRVGRSVSPCLSPGTASRRSSPRTRSTTPGRHRSHHRGRVAGVTMQPA
jgi:hypothetical protein